MTIQSELRGIALVLLIGHVVDAQEAWKSKPYQQWNKQDVAKLGSDSPWAQVQQADVKIGKIGTPANYMRAVTIQLRSALRMRQALVRLKQLEQKYDKMNESQRAEFDARMRATLECSVCGDKYIIAIGRAISGPGGNPVNTLEEATLGLLQKRVYIANERGERRELVHFNAPKFMEDEAVFFFPRLDEQGRPLLTPENKKLFFFFDSTDLRTGYGVVSMPKRVEFNVSRLIVDGKVDF